MRRIAFLTTSSLDYPSPRGRWLPLACELGNHGYHSNLLMLHHSYDQLPRQQRTQQCGSVSAEYVAQMHVYGPVGARRYFGPLALLRHALVGALSLAQSALIHRPDYLHVCKPQPINGLAGMLAARIGNLPLYVDCDDYEAGGNRFSAGWQQRLVAWCEDQLPRQAAGVTVNTHFLAARIREHGVDPERLVYVPNGLTAQQLLPAETRRVAGLRAALGLAKMPLAIYVGTLSETSHHVGLLLDAFALATQRIPTAQLLLVGGGEDRAQLEQQTRKLGIAGQVRFIGPVPYATVPAWLELADCSVDPVADTPVARGRSPLKIVESMAAGTPVLTSAVGDRAEMLGAHGGALVAPGDAAALASGLVAMLTHPPVQRQAVREQANNYRWDRLALRWATVYR